MLESHLSETNTLRLALSKKYRTCVLLRQVARRWERLAKTLRPQRLCPAVPKGLLLLGVRVRRFEEELAIGATNIAFRSPLIHRTLELFLLRWVNGVMAKARERHYWHPVKALERTKLQLAHEPGLPSSGDRRAFFTGMSLLYLVRELRWRYGLLAPVRSEADDVGGTMRQYAWLRQRGDREGGEMESLTQLPPAPSGLDQPEDHQNEDESQALHSLFAELVEVLYLPTQEGLQPPLLMHCPSLDQFFGPSHLLHPIAPVNMMWILSALFVGYVSVLTNYDLSTAGNIIPEWPAYLQCRVESDLAPGPHPLVSAAFYRNRQALKQCGSLSAQRGLANHLFGYKIKTDKEKTGDGSGTIAEEIQREEDGGKAGYSKVQGSKIITHNTRMTKGKKMSSRKGKETEEEAKTKRLPTQPRTMRNYLLTKEKRKAEANPSDKKRQKAEGTLRVVDLATLKDLSLVQDGYDTYKDIRVFIGVDNTGGEWESTDSESDVNVEALLRHAADVEDRGTHERRRQMVERDKKKADSVRRVGGTFEVEDLDTPPVTVFSQHLHTRRVEEVNPDKLNDSLELQLPASKRNNNNENENNNNEEEEELRDMLLVQRMVEEDERHTKTTVSSVPKSKANRRKKDREMGKDRMRARRTPGRKRTRTPRTTTTLIIIIMIIRKSQKRRMKIRWTSTRSTYCSTFPRRRWPLTSGKKKSTSLISSSTRTLR
ncbi:hypothetical protein AGDE_16351 [Angomonas deanei]|uniref:Uncharacterized protein n=1 Tax=Angomonas deanei TaxID=59799 RepID=A0A7G2C081_9TRYP|nr:hypothetical protein AGDE_16351 [Angomonas deanei]CAD2212925.1 hypothetical protein, conserved [Angomonas deanei]|eukprot:EPY17252.1 hypothetical protein AGDE_16351 [Angomonas deanei]